MTLDFSEQLIAQKKNLISALVSDLKVSPDKSLQGGPHSARRAVNMLIRLGKSTQVQCWNKFFSVCSRNKNCLRDQVLLMHRFLKKISSFF